MDRFNFSNMSDDEFRKEFLKIINMYKSGMDGYMKELYSNIKPNRMSEDDIIKNIFGQMPENMNIDRGTDEEGDWESKEWSSPDGLSSFRSYSRQNLFNPMSNKHKEDELSTIEVLNKRLKKAVDEEKYEEAGRIHKLIKQLNEED